MRVMLQIDDQYADISYVGSPSAPSSSRPSQPRKLWGPHRLGWTPKTAITTSTPDRCLDSRGGPISLLELVKVILFDSYYCLGQLVTPGRVLGQLVEDLCASVVGLLFIQLSAAVIYPQAHFAHPTNTIKYHNSFWSSLLPHIQPFLQPS
ncbi:hypothetical protein PGT21_031005 [Puccinia graminis f. sp. tritici]|uniref:Uncharacterized protein n=1 Tax=Puccinia graminis f. sp. tritici TaxID=56615 RepID=A0A5B0PC85_PUCGR|nr:hypothetical protein PGT21_031005 [Puccinia graminis f. sp. tritici]